MSNDLYDVIIIGGGPAGLSAAQYAARAKLKTIVLDKSSTAGAMAFASMIENYPGICEPMTGRELLGIFKRQAVGFGAEYMGDTQVSGVNLEGEVKEVFTMDRTFKGKVVIIATGSMGRKPTIEGEAEFLGKGVSYCAICDAAFFKGKTVCVLGDSGEAVKEAGLLTQYADTVYLISPAAKLKVDENHPALQASNLKILPGYRAKAIEGEEVVTGVRIIDSQNKESFLELSGVFVYIRGSRPIVDFLGDMVETTDEKCIVTNRLMYSSIPGVFAAGDVICTEIRQVVIAAANGCAAALSAEKFIRHRKRTKYDWSKGK